MILSFRNQAAADLHEGVLPRYLPAPLARSAMRKLWMLDAATRLEDIGTIPGNRLKVLRGNRAGQYSIRINKQWRICFRWHEGNAYDVEVTDYHR